MLSVLFCVSVFVAVGTVAAQTCECLEAFTRYSCHTKLWQCKDFVITGGLETVGSFQELPPQKEIHFSPWPSPPTTAPWYWHISLALSAPVKVTIIVLESTRDFGNNGSVLFNDPHTLGGVISVGVPKSFHQFSIKLLFDASEDGQTKFKLNYLVLTQNEHLQACSQPCVQSCQWIPSGMIFEMAPATTPTMIHLSSRTASPTPTTVHVSSTTASPTPTTVHLSSTTASLNPTIMHPSSSTASPTPNTVYPSSSTASPIPSYIPEVAPSREVGGLKLTWHKNNSVLITWDHVITDDITGYKLYWSNQPVQTNDMIVPKPINLNLSQYLISNKVLINSTKLYVYIWIYNLAGDGPIVNSTIIKPFTDLKCTNLSSFSVHYQWTEHVTVTSYDVIYSCSRTGRKYSEVVKSPPTERTFSAAEPNCLYTITLRAEEHGGYFLTCYTSTPEPKISAEVPKNQSFDEFLIHWKLHNLKHIPEDLDITLTTGSAAVHIAMSVGDVWTDTITINVTKPTELTTTVGSITENKDDGITWIFYIAAFCAVVIVLMLVMMMILALKHFQLCREMDKITNHRKKITESFKHESNGTNNQLETGP